MSTDWTDPDAQPLWSKKAKPDEPPEGMARIGPDGPVVTRVSAELKPEDIKTLPDGRRIRLVKELRFEIDGAADVRTQRFYQGPKQLGAIVAMEQTSIGWLRHVSFGYPNHEPSLHDVRCIRETFFEEEGMFAMWLPPRHSDLKDMDKADRMLVSLLEVPKSFTVSPVWTP